MRSVACLRVHGAHHVLEESRRRGGQDAAQQRLGLGSLDLLALRIGQGGTGREGLREGRGSAQHNVCLPCGMGGERQAGGRGRERLREGGVQCSTIC